MVLIRFWKVSLATSKIPALLPVLAIDQYSFVIQAVQVKRTVFAQYLQNSILTRFFNSYF